MQLQVSCNCSAVPFAAAVAVAAPRPACYDGAVLLRRLPLVVAVVAVVVVDVGCLACRRIEPRTLGVVCEDAAGFSGEIHLDSAPQYRNFLRDTCLPDSSDAAIEALVGEVDFSVDAVFVAGGPRAVGGRCVTARATESVDVCDEGLRVVFADEEEATEACGGFWTVSFAIDRGDLRAAVN